MRCTHPLYALDFGIDKNTGKRMISLKGTHNPDLSSLRALEGRYGHGSIIPLPCGKCLACKVNYSRDWSIRCLLEASLHKNNYFVTFTYDDEHLPVDRRLNPDDMTNFIKRLRNNLEGVRYFYCGEYGSTTFRPHYHAILFNCDIPDLKFIGNRDGNPFYESKFLRDLWQLGNIQVGEVTLATCEYVARYVIKKFNTKFGDEFLRMSLKPGLGAEYFYKHFETIYDTDGVYVAGQKHGIPRYFDKLLERLDTDKFRSIKYERIKDLSATRISALVDHAMEFDEQVLKYENDINVNSMKNKFKRGRV